MKKRTPDKFWFPWWPDKWIFGSIRIECTPIERGIWVDLLSLASKDDGHIRANEETPYPMSQLAGMLILPEDILDKAIKKFIKMGKLNKTKTGTLYVAKWNKYQFSDRHKRRVMSDDEDIESEKEDAILNKKKEKEIIEENKKHEKDFDLFWNAYDIKTARIDAFNAFKALRRKETSFEEIMEAVKGYKNHLKNEKIHKNFNKQPKYPAAFLRKEFWKDFIGIKYEAPL